MEMFQKIEQFTFFISILPDFKCIPLYLTKTNCKMNEAKKNNILPAWPNNQGVYIRTVHLSYFGSYEEHLSNSVERNFGLKYSMCGRERNINITNVILLEIFFFSALPQRSSTGAWLPKQHEAVIEKSERNPYSAIREIAWKLNSFNATTYKVLRTQLKLKPYKFQRRQKLSEDHKQLRLKFCNWIERTKNIFTDEW